MKVTRSASWPLYEIRVVPKTRISRFIVRLFYNYRLNRIIVNLILNQHYRFKPEATVFLSKNLSIQIQKQRISVYVIKYTAENFRTYNPRRFLEFLCHET